MNAAKITSVDLTTDVISTADLISMSEESLSRLVGGKASGLVRLLRAGGGFKVPPFFVVTTTAHLTEAASRQILIAKIDSALADLKKQSDAINKSRPITFAVRSSCLCEDQTNGSYAGQFETFLSVQSEDVFARILAVIKGADKGNISQYKRLMAIDDCQNQMAVLVQVMVEPDVAGVMFSVDPVNADSQDTVVINAVDGLADALVQGLVDGEHIVVRGHEVTRNGATEIDEAGLVALARQARELEKFYGFAVDVEWAVRNQSIYILQVRPVTTVIPDRVGAGGGGGSNEGNLRVFDGSNIQESYPGITTPMTFSFARRAYREVYRSFVRLMGVNDQVIGRNEDIFTGMLGFIDGHIYYNLGSWYRLLALLPAYKTNRVFMEKMMGLSEPALAVSPPCSGGLGTSIKEKICTMLALGHIGGEYLRLENSKSEFYKRLDKALDVDRAALKAMDMDGLCRLYRSLEMDLLTKWDAPIVNDFFAMIFFGIYQKLNSDQSTYHSLIEGLGNVVSARPPAMIKEIAELIKGDQALITAMLHNPLTPLVNKLFQAHQEAYLLYQNYLVEFGDRSIGELKLESQSVRENPSLLLATIATVAGARQVAAKTQLAVIEGNKPQHNKNQGHKSPLASFMQSAAKHLLLPLISERTRVLIAGRENLRFARTRVFGLVRDIMLSMADKLVQKGLLENRQDIFYLEIEEVLGFVEGGSTCRNLKALVALRRAEEKTYLKALPDRLPCWGPVGLMAVSVSIASEDLHGPSNLAGATAANELTRIKGLPACSGKVVGLARVIRDPASDHLLAGEILVAERTDPGWIMHFALCRAVVTSYGSMLSHTAIVARELKIPAVVAAKQATEMIMTGDLIEVDGATGVVTIIKRVARSRAVGHSEIATRKDCA